MKSINCLFTIGLALFFQINSSQAGQAYSLSWYYRGTAQQNNTVLNFNKDDTLNLACKSIGASTNTARDYMVIAINKGSKPPGLVYTDGGSFPDTFTVSDAGTLIYDDYNGIAAGFENFIVTLHQSELSEDFDREMRYISVGLLRPEDSGTYHCSGVLQSDSVTSVFSSGALIINVNTKAGQAHAPKLTSVNKLATYSAVMLTALKSVY